MSDTKKPSYYTPYNHAKAQIMVNNSLERLSGLVGRPVDNPEHRSMIFEIGQSESDWVHRRQKTDDGYDGTARGYFGVEPFTAMSLYAGAKNKKGVMQPPELSKKWRKAIKSFASGKNDISTWDGMAKELEDNPEFGVAMARARLYVRPGAIPKTQHGRAEYYVKWYNAGGKATVANFKKKADLAYRLRNESLNK